MIELRSVLSRWWLGWGRFYRGVCRSDRSYSRFDRGGGRFNRDDGRVEVGFIEVMVGFRSVLSGWGRFYRGDGRVDGGLIEVYVDLIDCIVGLIEVMVELIDIIIWLNQDVCLLFLRLWMHVSLPLYVIASLRKYVYVFQHLYVHHCQTRRNLKVCIQTYSYDYQPPFF